MPTYQVTDLQAVEPEFLGTVEGVTVTVDPEADNMGFARVTVEAVTVPQLLDYVRENWGDGDPDWFQTWVVDRVEEVGARTVLVHLNVEVPRTDPRNADEIADAIIGALESGLGLADGDLASGNATITTADGLTVTVPLAEEV